jgi:beta-lactam-binding protein with PASTA domain
VLEQSPAPGTAPAGSKVTIVVAEAPARPAVPDVVGQTLTDASAQLGSAGFTVSPPLYQAVTDAAQDGIVLSQTPPADEKHSRGSHVRLVVGRFDATATQTTPGATAPSGTP